MSATATKHTAMRLEPALLERIDALMPKLSTPWYRAKRSDVLRALILAGLPIVEREHAPKPSRKRGGR